MTCVHESMRAGNPGRRHRRRGRLHRQASGVCERSPGGGQARQRSTLRGRPAPRASRWAANGFAYPGVTFARRESSLHLRLPSRRHRPRPPPRPPHQRPPPATTAETGGQPQAAGDRSGRKINWKEAWRARACNLHELFVREPPHPADWTHRRRRPSSGSRRVRGFTDVLPVLVEGGGPDDPQPSPASTRPRPTRRRSR